jgi:Tat protein secretion system quality control protein TatD with DNase activity
MDLPIVIHSRDTMDIVLEILKTHSEATKRSLTCLFGNCLTG